MHINVVGCGYVGLVTGACLADIGHSVICVDNDLAKINLLRSGQIPIFEAHLAGIVKRNCQAGRLVFATDSVEAVRRSDVTFICVGTPPMEDGSADLHAIEQVARLIAREARSDHLVIEKSTVPVQTGRRIKDLLSFDSRANGPIRVASNPEFLREGTGVLDFMHPTRIVIGVEDEQSELALREIYGPILDQRFVCPVHDSDCQNQPAPEFVATSINSAELIKHASNTFLAIKISYANLLAEICERLGGDVEEVTRAMGLDPRIGKHFLSAGLGFGGFCLPKDIQAFLRVGEAAGVDVSLLKSAEHINNRCVDRGVEKIKEALWILRGKTVAVLGLSFKPETDDIRFSPALNLVSRLLSEGVTVRAFDPHALEKAKSALPSLVDCSNEYVAAEGADAIVIATDWNRFQNLDWILIGSRMTRRLVIDTRNLLDPEAMIALEFQYYGMGRQPAQSRSLLAQGTARTYVPRPVS